MVSENKKLSVEELKARGLDVTEEEEISEETFDECYNGRGDDE